ncbi:hypothetical protein [Nocardia sp. NPDC059239]
MPGVAIRTVFGDLNVEQVNAVGPAVLNRWLDRTLEVDSAEQIFD